MILKRNLKLKQDKHFGLKNVSLKEKAQKMSNKGVIRNMTHNLEKENLA